MIIEAKLIRNYSDNTKMIPTRKISDTSEYLESTKVRIKTHHWLLYRHIILKLILAP